MIFDRNHAALLASAAQASYSGADSLLSWGTAKQVHPQPFDGGNTQGFIATTDTAMHVVFRGTESTNLKDWQTDAMAIRIPSPLGGTVHAGFSLALDAVWSEVRAAIDQRGGRLLLLSGHSLGGALAVLAASRLPGVPLHLYTFGQPRVGDEDFAKSCEGMFGANYYRFVNDKDVVPRVPPFTLKYRHFGHELQIDANGIVQEVDFGVETIEDALRLAAGSQLPKAIVSLAQPLVEIVDSVARGNREIQPALDALNHLAGFLGFLPGGGGVKTFIQNLRNQTRALAALKVHPSGLESITDHDMSHYLRAAMNG